MPRDRWVEIQYRARSPKFQVNTREFNTEWVLGGSTRRILYIGDDADEAKRVFEGALDYLHIEENENEPE